MAALAEVFAKQLSPPLTDLYWEACKGMAIEQFQEGAKSWIKIGKHFPKPADLIERFKEMSAAAPKPFEPLPPLDAKWLRLVNGLFLKYITRRRLDEKFTGDINIAERREQCIRLAKFFEGLEAEGDEEATEVHIKIKFHSLMTKVAA